MRYSKTNQRRAVILMVVLAMLALFAIVGIAFVLYADAEAAAARVAREAQTQQFADVDPKEALSMFLGQLIYDVPDTAVGAASGLRGHSLARTMYGGNYTLPLAPGLNTVPFNGIGRMHYPSALGYPAVAPYTTNPVTNVPPNWGTQLDDYAMVNYTWFSGDNFVRDPERFGVRTNLQLTTNAQTNPYVGGNAPYTYPDLNNFYLAAVRADGTVLTPSYHRPWLFQSGVVNSIPKAYAFNDMTNPNWYNQQGKYLTLRPRPAEHPTFPLPGDATGDVKNLTWAPGGNDSIWIDLGAPVMTAPDGTLYKMMFAPLVMDLDGRVNLNTAGNILASINALTASSGLAGAAAWQAAAGAHVSNQGWGPWEVNLAKVLYGDQTLYPTTVPPTPPEWMRLLTGMSYATTNIPPNTLSFIVQPGAIPIPALVGPPPLPLSSWMLPGIPGRYVETIPAGGAWTPNLPPALAAPYYPSALGMNTMYTHAYSMTDSNGMNETPAPILGSSSRPLMPGSPPNLATGNPLLNPAINPFAMFQQGFGNGFLASEGTNHPLLYNIFQSPLNSTILSRAFRASDMEALLRPNASISGPVDANASASNSDLTRLCPLNFASDAAIANLPAAIKSLAMRYRNLVTTQSWDVGSPGVTPYWWNGMTTGYLGANPSSYLLAPVATQPAGATGVGFPMPPPPPTNLSITTLPSEYGPDWRSSAANTATYVPTAFAGTTSPTANPPGFVSTGASISPGARIRLNRPLPPYPHMGAWLMPPYNPSTMPPNATLTPYGTAYPFNATTPPNLTIPAIAGQFNQFVAAQQARQALANDLYRRLLAVAGNTTPFTNPGNPAINPADQANLAARRYLAQLAVNMVDYMDEDDIMTPFNFYTIVDGLLPNGSTLGTTLGPDDPTPTGANPAYWVFGTEMPKLVLNEALAEAQNPDPKLPAAGNPPLNDSVKVWLELFNTMPNPAVANPTTLHTQPQDAYRVPLYMTNPAGLGYSPYRISIAQYLMNAPDTLPKTAPPPGLVDVFNSANKDASQNVLGKAYIPSTPPLSTPPLPASTTDVDFSPANAANITMSQGGGAQPAFPVPGTAPVVNVNAGVDPGSFFLIGPKTLGGNPAYQDPFAGLPPAPLPSVPVLRTDSVSYNTTNWSAASTTDERTTGLSILLRRLANPYLPFNGSPTIPDPTNPANVLPNPYYNPYVTVDYMASVPIWNNTTANNTPNFTYASRGKTQPFAGLTLLNSNPTGVNPPPPPPNPVPGYLTLPSSPVLDQGLVPPPLVPPVPPPPYPPPPAGITPPTNYKGTLSNNTNTVINTFGFGNYPLPPSGHYDWLVHLDRPPISPMELLHVSAWPPYMLTQRFLRDFNGDMSVVVPGLSSGSDNLSNVANIYNPANAANAVNKFGHYAPWFDAPPAGITAANLATMSCPWWFDLGMQVGPSSHRLYRLFEFLECGDRAFGVNGLGRIPGKININTVWDSEILQAIIDANPSMGINVNPSNTPLNLLTDPVSQVFANMIASRSQAQYNGGTYTNTLTMPHPFPIGPVNMGTGLDDRPFMPLSTGLNLGKSSGCLQYPNGFGVSTDTLLRTNDPLTQPVTYPIPAAPAPAANTYMLFQNYNDASAAQGGVAGGLTTPAVHPYLQTQMLNKLYNNVTTRSNTFAVFLTVGFFQVIPGGVVGHPNVPQLGPEIGLSEGKQIRHRMFAIVDRTNLTTCTTTGQVLAPGVTGPTPNVSNPASPVNYTGVQTITVPLLPPSPNLTVTGIGVGPATQLFVPNLTTGMPGMIQAGTQLVIDAGTPWEETVTVISATAPPLPLAPATITANFTLPHGVGGVPFTITQRGNPGPWVLIPYDPRLDPSVVPYFSIID